MEHMNAGDYTMNDYIKNCLFCVYHENEYGLDTGNVDYCAKNTGKDNLKSFPFKTPQKCHHPDFWKVLQVDSDLQNVYYMENADEKKDIQRTKTYHKFISKYLSRNDE